MRASVCAYLDNVFGDGVCVAEHLVARKDVGADNDVVGDRVCVTARATLDAGALAHIALDPIPWPYAYRHV